MNPTAIRIRGLRVADRGDKGISRPWGLDVEALDLPSGERILVLGERGSGKGALIDHVDRALTRGRPEIVFSEEVTRARTRRVNGPDDVVPECLLVLSEGHDFEKQKAILARCAKGTTVLASMDLCEIVGPEILAPFSYVVLMHEGHCVFAGSREVFVAALVDLKRYLPALANLVP